MACSPRNEGEDGYATATAAMIALALAVVAAAVVGAATTELRTARAEFDRRGAEFALDGVQLMAQQALMMDGVGLRYRWTLPSTIGEVEILAEREAAKMSLSAAAEDVELLDALGVRDGERLRGRLLAAEAARADAVALGRLDAARAWRGCAASLMSPYGQARKPGLVAAKAPAAGRVDVRPGQVWRLRAASRSGWADERIVRFTGDRRHPAAVVERSFARGGWRGEPCKDFIVEEGAR